MWKKAMFTHLYLLGELSRFASPWSVPVWCPRCWNSNTAKSSFLFLWCVYRTTYLIVDQEFGWFRTQVGCYLAHQVKTCACAGMSCPWWKCLVFICHFPPAFILPFYCKLQHSTNTRTSPHSKPLTLRNFLRTILNYVPSSIPIPTASTAPWTSLEPFCMPSASDALPSMTKHWKNSVSGVRAHTS